MCICSRAVMRRSLQVLVLAAVAGCTEAPDPDTIVAFRVVDQLGATVPGAEVTCRGVDVDDDYVRVDGAVADLGTGTDFECTMPAAADGVITLVAEIESAYGRLSLHPTLTEVRDVVVWRPAIAVEILDATVVVSWDPPLLDSPDPTWERSLSLGGSLFLGTRDLDPSATSSSFPLEDLEDDDDRTLFVRTAFDSPMYSQVESQHHVSVTLPTTDSIVPRSRGAACQLIYRYRSQYGDDMAVFEVEDFAAGACPLTDGQLWDLQCPDKPTICDVVGGTIDLGELLEVRRIRIHDDTEWDTRTIEIGEDGVVFTLLEAYDPLPSTALARYVRIRSDEDRLQELSVFTAQP